MYITLISGGVASGKSRAASYLSQIGAELIDLDMLSREVLSAGSPLLKDIAKHFGADLIGKNGELKRQLLADRVFSNYEKLKELEVLELPAIGTLLQERIDNLAAMEPQDSSLLVLVEIPVYDKFQELGIDREQFDELLYIYAPYEIRRERAIGRGMSEADFQRRANLQSTARLEEDADYTIDNSGSVDILYAALEHWYKRLQEEGLIRG